MSARPTNGQSVRRHGAMIFRSGASRANVNSKRTWSLPLPVASVRDRVGAFVARNLDQLLGDDRPRNRRAEQVVAFVHGAGPQHREDEVAREFLAQIDDVKLARAGLERLFFESLGFVALPHVGAVGDHFASEVILDPAQHHRRVESAGVREHQFFYFFGCHDSYAVIPATAKSAKFQDVSARPSRPSAHAAGSRLDRAPPSAARRSRRR